MSDMGWPVFEKCTHPNLGSRDVCPDCCALVMRVCIRNGEFVHWLAAKMAEPTAVSRASVPSTEFKLAGVRNWRVKNCTISGPAWDTLHRTQDGGYWIPPDLARIGGNRDICPGWGRDLDPKTLEPTGPWTPLTVEISTEPEPDAKADIWKAIEDSCKR